jgi:uncharacterized protein YigA (DUF484 family)
MSELSDMMQELNQKRQANKELQEDNDKLKSELLRMKKVHNLQYRVHDRTVLRGMSSFA